LHEAEGAPLRVHELRVQRSGCSTTICG
jgi:hypothetical protein